MSAVLKPNKSFYTIDEVREVATEAYKLGWLAALEEIKPTLEKVSISVEKFIKANDTLGQILRGE